MASGFLAGGGWHAAPPAVDTLTTAAGPATTPTESATEHGSGWPYKVIASFDTHKYAFFDPGEDSTITVGASTGDASGIASVTFYLNGNSVTVTNQGLSDNNSTYGFRVKPSTGAAGTDGDFTLYARVVPVNGFERLLSLPITLNSNGTITRPLKYVNYSTGNDTTGNGSQATPWKTIAKATGAVSASPGGAADIICASGTYLENASGSGNSNNSRMVKIRPATGASVTISRTTRGTPSRDLVLGCSKFQVVGCTIAMDKFAAVSGVGTVYSVITGCTMSDANGVLGPFYGYNTTEQFDNPGFFALEECTILCPIAIGLLERNITSKISWDAWMVGASSQTNNTTGLSRWNVDLRQPNQFVSRASTPNTLTVSTSAFSGVNTTLTFASGVQSGITQGNCNMLTWGGRVYTAPTITGAADNGSGRTRLTVTSTAGLTSTNGVLGNQIMIRGVVGTEDILGANVLNDVWSGITVVDATHIDLPAASAFTAASGAYAASGSTYVSGGTVMLSANSQNSTTTTITITSFDATATIKATDDIWFTTPAHADSDQYFTGGSNTVPYYDNIYWQRVKHVGVSLQHVLCQAGAGTAAGSTISGGADSDSGLLTFTAAHGMGVNGWIIPNSGAQSGKAFRIETVNSTTTVTLAANHRPAVSIVAATTWKYTLGISNHAQIECVLEGASTNGQMQGGATHWVVDGCSFLGAALNFRNDGATNITSSTEAQDAVVYRNSIFYAIGVQGGTFPTRGVTIDNCQFLNTSTAAAAIATNSTTLPATFNTTFGSNYGRPTSGVNKSMTPPIPYDCSGRAIVDGTNIGGLEI